MKTRLARLISLVLALLLLAGLLPASVLAAGDDVITAQVTMGSLLGGMVTDTCYYSDAWFREDSAALNYHLATLSVMASVISSDTPSDGEGAGISALLQELGFGDIRLNAYYAGGIKLADSVGCIIGRKTVADRDGNEVTLLAVFPRSGGYEAEWAGNFNVGASGIHQGFLAARDEILRFMKQYMGDNGISGRVKIWAAGYSRGAAVINLVGGFLAEDSGYFGDSVRIAPEDVFVYTAATPANIPDGVTRAEALSVAGSRAGLSDTDGTAYVYAGADADTVIQPDDSRYGCIHNFTAYGDYFTKLPPAVWGFTRYGDTVSVEFGGEDMLAWLRLVNEDTAEQLAEKGGYSTPLPLKALDLRQRGLTDTAEMLSTDAMITQRMNALAGITGGSRESLVTQGITAALGNMTAALSTELTGAGPEDAESPEKAAVLNYLAYALEQQRKADPAITDEAGVAEVLFQIMEFLGLKVEDKENYTAQQLLKDVLAALLKLAQEQSRAVEAQLPEEYAQLWKDFLAQAQEIQPATIDDLIKLITVFAVDPQHLPFTQSLFPLLSGLVPEESGVLFRTMIAGVTKQTYDNSAEGTAAAVTDLITGCALGNGETDASVYRSSLRRLIQLSFMKELTGQTALTALLTDSAEAPSDPVSFETMVRELVLANLLEKDETGKAMSLTASADKTLGAILGMDGAAAIRAAAGAILLDPQEDYSFVRDLTNGVNFADRFLYLLPAHFPELYLSWLKSMDDLYVLPEAGDSGKYAYEEPVQPACPDGEACPLRAFTDLDPTAPYHDGIAFVLEKGVMQGYGDGTFGPYDSINRAMMAQILWNLEGNPEDGTPLDYTDVTDANWFAPAVRWATGSGILQGYGNGKFGPKDTLTREQLITIVYRYAQLKGVAVEPDANILDYEDVFEVSSWAVEAFRWAVQEQLLEGETTLSPKEDASRALIATIIMRYFTGVGA